MEKLENMTNKEHLERNAFIFLKGFFTKMGKRKMCGWYPVVLFSFPKENGMYKLEKPLHSNLFFV